jgi:hypothetical protein
MPNPLWVDARDYLTNKGVPVTTGNLNSAMGFLAQNVDARPSYAKASPDAATSIGAGLGMPTDDLVRPVQDTDYLSLAQHVPNRASSNPEMRGTVQSPIPPAPSGITAAPLAAPKPTSYAPPQAQARPQPRTQGPATRTEKTASTRSQPKALPVNNRTEAASGRSDPITTPASTGSAPNIHATPDNAPLPPNVNPAIPDVSNGAYAPGGLEVDGLGGGTLAAGGAGLAAALMGMILSRGRGGRLPNAPRIPGVGASPLETRLPPGSPPPITGPAPITGPLPTGAPPPVYVPPPMMGPPPVRPAPPIRGPAPVSGTMEDILTAPPRKAGTQKVPVSPTGKPTFAPKQQAEIEQMMADEAKKRPPAPPREKPKTKTTVKIDKKKAAKK